MRFVLYILMIIGVTGLVVYFYSPETYSCIRPIKYSIGELDERFNLSEEELLSALKKAEDVWEKAAGKELFEYDEKGRFKVNLIYDERQQKTDLVEQSEVVLNQKEKEYESADGVYRDRLSELDAAVTEFNAEIKAFELRRDRYQQSVEAWNRSPRTDKSRLDAIQKEEKEIRALEAQLKNKEANIKQMQRRVDEALRVRNELARNYNIDVSVFNQQFGTAESFDQGIYTRRQINIYQFRNIDDLTLVLAHEFGHALGLDHVEDPNAVMYYLMEDQSTSPIMLSPDDKSALEARCAF